MNATLRLFAPVVALSGFAFVLFGLDAMASRANEGLKRASFWVALAGLLVTALLIPDPGSGGGTLFGRQMLIWDGLSYFLSWIVVLTVFFVILLSEKYRDFSDLRLSAYLGLLNLAAIGLIFLSAANDFLMIFLSIELFGVPSFILVGYLRRQARSSEAAIKLFLIGAFSSAMLAYGISILYGITGSTSLTMLHANLPLLVARTPLATLAILFIVVSFGFKIALVPFHMWVPDAFEGAPMPIAALLSVAPKIAGAAIALRVFNLTLTPPAPGALNILAALAVLTMTIANVIGLQQTRVIRLLAYSSIAHMGYLLLGIVAGTPMGMASVYVYGWVYLFMNLGAFAIVIALSNALGSDEISAYAGLSRRSPRLSVLLVLFLVSLAGIPPTAGFVAKFSVFAAAYEAGWKWLVVAGAINSVISVGYYFKIAHAMYFKKSEAMGPIELSFSTLGTLGVASFFTLLLGFSPQYYLLKAQSLVPNTQVSAPAAPVAP
jgi:NADH-quinone oxidoreductase subunit N